MLFPTRKTSTIPTILTITTITTIPTITSIKSIPSIPTITITTNYNYMKKHLLLRSAALCLVLSLSVVSVMAQQLAFPGAAGWGRFAKGARASSTPTVYHVTNLNDSGTGSLRDAVSQPNRIVVFDVSGVIKLNSMIVFKNNLYVAGQTAPGEGVTVYGGRVSFSGATNTIVRYMRFRLGHAAGQVDCAGAANGNNMIFDHCSFGWGGDETFSLNPDGKNGGLYDITLSNCIMGQGLMPHSAGGLIQADNITLYRNVYCDNSTRNNKIKGKNQYANNLVYNWQNAAYNMGGDSEGESYCNIQSNLFINGPAKGGAAFTGGNSNFHFYGDDNWQDSNMDGIYNPLLVASYSAADRQSTPYDYPELELYPGNELIEKNLPSVGASLPYRDYVDCYMVDEIMSYGKKGALVADESTLVYGIPTTWKVWSGHTRIDTDKDGMPDEWENANGTDPSVNDATVVAANGYLNIENYVNSLTIDNRQYFLRTPMVVEQTSATTTTMTINWRDWTDSEEGFIVEIQNSDNVWEEKARTAANATSVTISGLSSGTQYQVRLCAFAGEKKSDYTDEIKMSTRPEVVGMIDPDTYVPEMSLSTTGTAEWGGTDLNWNNGTEAYSNGKETLIAPDSNTTLNLTGEHQPTNVVIKGDTNLTLAGTGNIGGSGSLNKAGTGILTINVLNDYKGATVLHDGVLEFNTIAEGGSKSAIGSSVEFAQNWVWNGGIYRYTGGNATTNRSFQLLQNTKLEILNKATTVTFSGGSIEGALGANSTATFILDGEGTLNVDDKFIEKHNGAIQLDGGTLYTPTEPITKAYGANLKKLIMNGGTLKTVGTTSGYETYSFPIEVKEGSTSTLDLYRNNYMNNTLSGKGTLVVNVPYLREYVNFKYNNFTGRIIANGKSSEKGGSLYVLQKGATGMTQAVLELSGNARLCGWDTSASWAVGGLAGGPNTCISGSSKDTSSGWTATWTIGSANTDETFHGTSNNFNCSNAGNGTVVITKVGTGLWRLTNNNLEHRGATTVSGGILVMNGTLKNSAITVASGAKLAGTGTISQAAKLNNGAFLNAGDTLVNGKGLTFASTLTLTSGNTVNMPVTLNKCNTITLNGVMTIGANSVLNITAGEEGLSRAPYDKTEYQIFKIGSTGSISGTFASISTDILEDGQSWDASELYTNGILRVVGGDEKPADDPEDDPKDDPSDVGETLKVTLAFGNMTNKSYNGSDVLNMLEGNENKTTNGILNDNRGFQWVCTGNLTKALSKGSKMTYTFDGTQRTNVKISNGAQQTIFLPEDSELGKARATKIELWSVVGTNSDNRTSYWKEICGTQYTAENATILDLTAGKVNCVTFDLNSVEQITFTNTGEQQCVIVNIEYHYGGVAGQGVVTGIYDVNAAENPFDTIGVYDLFGRKVNVTTKGLYILNGKKYFRK